MQKTVESTLMGWFSRTVPSPPPGEGEGLEAKLREALARITSLEDDLADLHARYRSLRGFEARAKRTERDDARADSHGEPSGGNPVRRELQVASLKANGHWPFRG